MSYKQALIRQILAIDTHETTSHLNRLPVRILEGFLLNYRRYNRKK
jgi:hypothetical protein